MFVKKLDGGLRLVIDFRGINAVTVKNKFPLPLIGEMLDRLHEAKVFTKIDLRNAYHQVRTKEGDEWMTAFESLVCPMGLTNAPACFQRFINEILKKYLDLICVGILDDVIIYSKIMEEHIPHVRSILAVLRKHCLYAKIQKCEFHKPSMTFVGFLVSADGIGMDPSKGAAITKWAPS